MTNSGRSRPTDLAARRSDRLGSVAAGLAATAGDLLLGAVCPGCRRPGWGLCPDCRAELAGWRPHWVRPDPCPAGFPPTVAVGPYAGLGAELISAHKDHQALGLARVLGGLLTAAVVEVAARADGRPADRLTDRDGGRLVLVPAPSAPRAVRERGLDAGRAIAVVAARRLHRSEAGRSEAGRSGAGRSGAGRSGARPVVVRSWLRHARTVRDQSGLDAGQRSANLTEAMRAKGSPFPRPGDALIIVDDVVTTGATLAEAARVLTEIAAEGCDVRLLGAATVAATRRRRPPSIGPLHALSDD
ncbi:MAG TPA: ComF family protein [Microlunatus sp.]|nr:ComF family protein [Microlunatus sp.]